MSKIGTLLLLVLLTTGCSTIEHEERPSRVEKVTLPNGKVVNVFVVGYSTEDFLKEFYCPSCD